MILQEGLVDVWVELSEGSVLPLRELPPEHYGLRVRSLDPEVVAVAPSPRSSQPRVIAIGPGKGELLQVLLIHDYICIYYIFICFMRKKYI